MLLEFGSNAAADKGVLAMVIFNQLKDAFFVFLRAWF
jgi:hypothetical protein